ncbi:MAG: hsp70 family protein [Candidatus Accumulibacter phosphatis]|uniref:Heat shock protein 70 n=2 Tax=Candidatus Accumulibacter TaxID=327159 RepID=A0A080M2X7_9PROT|nr:MULTISPECIES: Hsp70 family protein [Candidatus Accumulibacter]KFB75617.1 MAG: Heat shock protein 70 [Candidatus Accumulibacter cognatus]MCC2868612.1 hsp70 family protein [Candidatus Accumulibacter phosphatis]MCM8579255.1 hsp70 family protein [Accumulibacter sp.]MCQ1547485.1 hsp70 family protein [Candidatus Accumulibacter phosphatis]TMQ76956.1 Chaperone protein DnaK [Candidatus Accumulibacter phosphatis]
MRKPYIVGIDLGTSNTVVAYSAPGKRQVELFEIEQLVGPGQVAARPLLPSVRFHPAAGEISPGDLQLPWVNGEGGAPVVTGRLALDLGAQVPGRLVASAKSWLSHAAVDRLAPILPWGAAEEVAKVSPVLASASYLAHVRAAWQHRFPKAPLEQQQVILTVPASFDEGARALTIEAARQAGLANLRLLEEPQAAFYDWLFRHQQSLAEELAATRLLMVCDVGGGTTDLTLIQVAIQDGQPVLTRIGVGDHLMLGGDNMDLALAHLVESRLPASEGRLSAPRFSQLTARCRVAKEQLLAAGASEAVQLTLLGGGSRLIGGARTVELKRDEVLQVIVDGFFPRVPPDAPVQQRHAAIVEFGLPYPADPAITRHVAAFLRRHAQAARQALGDTADPNGEPGLPVPDTLLFNGGVFRADALAERLQDTLGEWRGAALRLLHNDNPDVAVARGAVAYALIRQEQGRRIGGGSARSYFLLLDEQGQQRRGICLLPRGTEEGHEIRLPERIFSLRLGQPVRFHLASSVADNAYRPGEITLLDDDDFVRLPPIATVVQALAGSNQREVRVQLSTAMTEVGTLEIHCVGVDDAARRWLLEFQLRGDDGHTAVSSTVLPARFADAVQCIERIFGASSQALDNKEVRRLRGQIEHLLGKREDWEMPLLRALFDVLLQRARRRRRSPEHERLWLNLAGFCLRPGLGYALDEWRVEQLCDLFPQGIQYVNESQNWSEWWILWRRAAGGLPAAVQNQLLAELGPWLRAEPTKSRSRLAATIAGSHDDMLRLVASLERLPVECKLEVGEWLLERLRKSPEKTLGWWAIGRIGARQSLYGSAHQVIPAEVASRWLQSLLALDWKKVEPAAFAATQIARRTGDRARDLPDDIRSVVLARLAAINASATWIRQVQSVVELDKADQRRAFGESLPAGLKLVPEPGSTCIRPATERLAAASEDAGSQRPGFGQ